MIRWEKREENLIKFSLFLVAKAFRDKKEKHISSASEIDFYNKICRSVKALRKEVENKAPREKIVRASVAVASDALMLIYHSLFNANEHRNNS